MLASSLWPLVKVLLVLMLVCAVPVYLLLRQHQAKHGGDWPWKRKP